MLVLQSPGGGAAGRVLVVVVLPTPRHQDPSCPDLPRGNHRDEYVSRGSPGRSGRRHYRSAVTVKCGVPDIPVLQLHLRWIAVTGQPLRLKTFMDKASKESYQKSCSSWRDDRGLDGEVCVPPGLCRGYVPGSTQIGNALAQIDSTFPVL